MGLFHFYQISIIRKHALLCYCGSIVDVYVAFVDIVWMKKHISLWKNRFDVCFYIRTVEDACHYKHAEKY